MKLILFNAVRIIVCLVVGIYVYAFLMNELMGRGPAERYYKSLPGREKANSSAEEIKTIYLRLLAEHKVNTNSSLSDLIAYLNGVQEVKVTNYDYPINISPSFAQKPDRFIKLKCVTNDTDKCFKLSNGGLLIYTNDKFSTKNHASSISFTIDSDGKYSARHDSFNYELNVDGALIPQAEMDLVTLF